MNRSLSNLFYTHTFALSRITTHYVQTFRMNRTTDRRLLVLDKGRRVLESNEAVSQVAALKTSLAFHAYEFALQVSITTIYPQRKPEALTPPPRLC
jgi:hypothetical protein